ncbi:hypothetical protein HY989_00415 [Candidatus Micrarchaeota archaeon]|nr:hypothetical protein [Candidatus Micrarchaeota archaeon]
MSEEFRDELISISEKLGKYNSAMQESLNILSDEFLLLRDELSTLNQSLEKTQNLDSKLDDFGKSIEVLHGLQEKLHAFEKIADSLSIADNLAVKVDQLAGSVSKTKENMDEAVLPLSKKMDMLFSRFDENIGNTNKKIDSISEIVKEGKRGSQESAKEEVKLKDLAIAIQEELDKMHKSYSDQTNSIKSIGTSVAYLSTSEGELKKSLDGLVKIYEQDREKIAQEKAKSENERKNAGSAEKSPKLDEIVALLRVQNEEMQKQQRILESIKEAPKKTGLDDNVSQELKTTASQIARLQQSINEQVKMLAMMKDSMPSGNFEEVIRHADVINQNTNSKLDSLIEINDKTVKALTKNSDKDSSMPSLMQNISAALDALVSEMKKSQIAYKNLESKVEGANLGRPDAPSHMEKLEIITENIRGLHSKMEESPQVETTLRQVIEELRKFESLEQQKLEKMEKLALNSQSQQVSTAPTESSTKTDLQLLMIKKDISSISANVETLKSVLMQGADITAEVDFAPLLKKLEEIQGQLGKSAQIQPLAQKSGSAPLTQERLVDFRDIMDELMQNVRIFESFELSDRAKIVVDRIGMLTRRAIAFTNA